MKITAIYDNGGRTLDRYTIITDKITRPSSVMALGTSENPDDYNGISQWGEVIRNLTHNHLGRRITFEQLSAALQTHVARRILREEE